MTLCHAEHHRKSQAVLLALMICSGILLGNPADYCTQSSAVDLGFEASVGECGDADDEAAGSALPGHARPKDGAGQAWRAVGTHVDPRRKHYNRHLPRAPPGALNTQKTPNRQ